MNPVQTHMHAKEKTEFKSAREIVSKEKHKKKQHGNHESYEAMAQEKI